MANSWLRLWHDMPNDPKWRTIARISGQPISLVLATYMHLLVDASRNVTRGNVTVTLEDLASALDVTDDQIQSILSAMEGRVIESGQLSGWDRRQPKREDFADEESAVKGSTQRQRDKRARDKASKESAQCHAEDDASQQSHAESRNVTLDKDKDKDKDSVTKVTATDGGNDAQALQPTEAELTKAELWAAGKSLLAAQGMPAKQCGSFVGGLVKKFGDAVVVEAVRTAVMTRPADAAEYLTATCQHSTGNRQHPNKQEALEARNQSAVDQWLAQEDNREAA